MNLSDHHLLRITSGREALVWITFAIAIGVYLCGPIVDPDLWWHIVSGRWILHHHAVPHVDYWNMFGVGKPWRAYSWSIECLFAVAEQSAGLRGLLVIKIILASSFGLIAAFTMAQISRSWFMGATLGAFVVLSCHDHFTLRPQSFIWIYLLVLLWWLDRWLEGRAEQRKTLLGCAVIMALWANAQITSVIGIIAAVSWVCRGDSSRQNVCEPFARIAARMAAVFFSALIGTLITPYWGREWLTFFSKTGHPLTFSAIAEFHPATIMQFPTAFTVLLTAFLLFGVALAPRHFSVVRIVIVGGFVLAGLAVVKFLPFAAIMVSATIAAGWRDMGRAGLRPYGNVGEGILRLAALVNRLPKEGLSFVMVAWSIVTLVGVWRAPLASELIPTGAVDFIEAHSLPHPVMNDFGRGGYLMYRYADTQGTPRHLVSIDGRTNVGVPEIWESYYAAEVGALNWRDYVNLVNPRTILWRLESPLTTILLTSNEWCLVYRTESRGLMARAKSDRLLGYAVFLRRDEFELRRGEGALRAENCR